MKREQKTDSRNSVKDKIAEWIAGYIVRAQISISRRLSLWVQTGSKALVKAVFFTLVTIGVIAYGHLLIRALGSSSHVTGRNNMIRVNPYPAIKHKHLDSLQIEKNN
ncbi:MAG: hypothetical protein ACN6O7_00630 [Sphingobacterium sp.]